MARKKTDNPFPNCIRVREPNKEKLAELVLRAKGEKRSISAFARDCGVSTSTLSRLINMETSKANSDDLIATIAEHVDPESGVTLNELLDAHGLTGFIIPSKSCLTYNKFGPLVAEKVYFNLSNYYQSVKGKPELDGEDAIHMLRIVTERIFKMKKRKNINDNIEIVTGLIEYTYDIEELFRWAPEKMEKKRSWHFHVHTDQEKLIDVLKRLVGDLYFGSKPGCKNSIITVQEGEFNALKVIFQNRKIKDCVSIILVDLDADEVVDEFQFPMLREWDKKWMLK